MCQRCQQRVSGCWSADDGKRAGATLQIYYACDKKRHYGPELSSYSSVFCKLYQAKIESQKKSTVNKNINKTTLNVVN